MKTLINKNKIRLAGGLAVLLMTAIFAVVTAKSACWVAVDSNLDCSLWKRVPDVTVCTCCFVGIPWCCDTVNKLTCVPAPNGVTGYGSCEIATKNITIQCGITWKIGAWPPPLPPDSPALGCRACNGPIIYREYPFPYLSTFKAGEAVFSDPRCLEELYN
jgi:hypothetical protein